MMAAKKGGFAMHAFAAAGAGFLLAVLWFVNRLVALVMVLTLAAICAEIVLGENRWWIGWGSLALAGSGFVLAITRTVPNAVRLGRGNDSPEQQSTLARAIYRDHLLSFGCMMVVLGLQLTAR